MRIVDPVAAGTTQIVDTIIIADDGSNGPDPTPGNNTDTDTDNLVTLPNADITKTLIATNQAHTITPAVAIGEILTYQVDLTIPQGTAGSATLTDVLDLGLAYVGCTDPTVVSGVVTTTLPGGLGDICAPPPGSPAIGPVPIGSTADADQGRSVTFALGSLTNPGPANAVLRLSYRAVVLDNPENVRSVNLNNQATWRWNGGVLTESAADVTIVEPTLALEKTAAPRSVPPGGVVTFTITVTHPAPPSDSPAFDLELTDNVPLGMTYVPGWSLATGGGVIDATAAPLLHVEWGVLVSQRKRRRRRSRRRWASSRPGRASATIPT